MKQRAVKPQPTPYWTRVLDAAEKKVRAGKKPFTQRQVALSGAWQTCVCGKQDPRIPRFGSDDMLCPGAPIDDDLGNLGASFHWAVEDANTALPTRARLPYVLRARALMRRIERRAAIVLTEVLRGGARKEKS